MLQLRETAQRCGFPVLTVLASFDRSKLDGCIRREENRREKDQVFARRTVIVDQLNICRAANLVVLELS